MKQTRREVLKKALIAAVAAASPATLLRAAGRVASMKLPLADGSELEFSEREIFLIKAAGGTGRAKTATGPSRAPVTDGDFRLKGGGHLVVKRGTIVKFDKGGSASGEFFAQGPTHFHETPGFIEFSKPGDKVSNPGQSVKGWLLKNQAGDELSFRGR